MTAKQLLEALRAEKYDQKNMTVYAICDGRQVEVEAVGVVGGEVHLTTSSVPADDVRIIEGGDSEPNTFDR